MERQAIQPAPPRPILKWAGGKRQLLGALRAHLPADWAQRRYYEPFLGAGALLFDLSPHRAVVNDANEQLILTYRTLKRRRACEAVISLLEEHRRSHCEDYYYQIRAMDRAGGFAALPDPVKAARLIYLNKTCFNGLYRVNAQGYFNVPYGRYSNPAICEAQALRAMGAYLRQNKITLRCGDFAAAVRGARRDSFVYFDPPYHSPGKANFTGYQADCFGEAQQVRLHGVFAQLTRRGVPCLLSNSATEFIRGLYADYPQEIVPARRAINANAAARGAVDEILIWNW